MSGAVRNASSESQELDADKRVGVDALETSGISSVAKNVLIYGINYTPEPIGVGRYTGDIGEYLSRNGVCVTVVTAIPHYPGWAPRDGYSNRYNAEYISDVRIVRCPLFLKSEMRGVWRLIAPLSFAITSTPIAIWMILARRPDTIICVEPTLFSAPIALFFGKLVGARTVLHVQDLEVDAAFAVGHLGVGKLRRIAHWFETRILKGFSSVITISTGMRDMLLAKGVLPERLSVVRNWVNTEKIKPMQGHPWVREELDIAPDAFIVLYAGNIGPKQALPLMLDVAAKFAHRSDVVFIVVGDGPEKISLVARYGHLRNVRFMPVQSEDRFCELLSSVDCHLLPQHIGTTDMMLPSKLGGMLASGRPCIVMAGPGTELFNFLADAAIMVPPGDARRLLKAIEELVDGGVSVDANVQLELVKRLDEGHCIGSFSKIVLA